MMIIEFEGRSWEYDEDTVSVQQAMALFLAYGLTIKAWQQAIPELDPRAVQFCYWLMLSQNGVKPGLLKDIEFAAVEFMSAYMKGLRGAAAEDDAEPEPDPTPPSPPDGPPSPEPPTPPATTPRRRPRAPAEATAS